MFLFFIWLLSLSVIFLIVTHVAIAVLHFFLLLNDIPSCACISVYPKLFYNGAFFNELVPSYNIDVMQSLVGGKTDQVSFLRPQS